MKNCLLNNLLVLGVLIPGIDSLAAQKQQERNAQSLSQTGPGSGGGGNAVICFSHPSIVDGIKLSKMNGGGYIEDVHIPFVTSVEMLDLRKIKQPRWVDGEEQTQEIMTAQEGETEKQFDSRLKARFEKINPLATQLLMRGKSKIVEWRSVPSGIAPVDDVAELAGSENQIRGEVYNTKLCVRATIVYQYLEGTTVYAMYDERIYGLPRNVFDVTNRVASRWHEYFYSLADGYGPSQSQSTQTLVGKLFLKNISYLEFQQAFYYFGKDVRSDFVDDLLSDFDKLLEERSLNSFHRQDEFDTSAAHLLFPVIGLSLIPAEIAFRMKASSYRKDCEKIWVKQEKGYESKKSEALNLLDESLMKLRERVPEIGEGFFSALSEILHQKISQAQMHKSFELNRALGGFNAKPTCSARYNFELKTTASELHNLVKLMPL